MNMHSLSLTSLALASLALSSLCLASPAAAAAAATDFDADGVADAADAFPCDARRAGVSFLPSEFGSSMLMLEDNWPEEGDLDFNDAVIAYHVAYFEDGLGQVTGLRIVATPRALGARLRSGLSLRLPVDPGSVASIRRTVNGVESPANPEPGESSLVVVLAADLRATSFGLDGHINTSATGPAPGDGAQIVLEIDFVGPSGVLPGTPLDLFFFRSDDPSHQIHRPEFPGTDRMNRGLFNTAADTSSQGRWFVHDGLPFVLSIPTLTAWPNERTPVDHVWPGIVAFARSGGLEGTDFFTSSTPGKHWADPGSVSIPEQASTCVLPSCRDGIQNGSESDVDCGGVSAGERCPECPSCSDGAQNGLESGVDCGGPNCAACPPTCQDGVRNGGETGVDCGGFTGGVACPACPPTCSDGIQNGSESGIDCGGPTCPVCLANCIGIADVDIPTRAHSFYGSRQFNDSRVSSDGREMSDWFHDFFTLDPNYLATGRYYGGASEAEYQARAGQRGGFYLPGVRLTFDSTPAQGAELVHRCEPTPNAFNGATDPYNYGPYVLARQGQFSYFVGSNPWGDTWFGAQATLLGAGFPTPGYPGVVFGTHPNGGANNQLDPTVPWDFSTVGYQPTPPNGVASNTNTIRCSYRVETTVMGPSGPVRMAGAPCYFNIGYLWTPLVLDLSAAGPQAKALDLVPMARSPRTFDFAADGTRPLRSGWIGRQSGLLALDLDGNGLIDDGRELFGEAMPLFGTGERARDGYEALAQFDENGDGWVDEADPVYAAIVVWVDPHGDGLGQLVPLKSLDIQAISVRGAPVSPDASARLLAAGGPSRNQVLLRSRYLGPKRCGSVGCFSYDVRFEMLQGDAKRR